MSPAEILGLAASAAAAGLINAVAGGGTLITFPTLLLFETAPKIANATSTLALVIGTAGGVFGFRKQLDAVKAWLWRLIPPSLVGGGLGSWLLTRTSDKAFARLVPFLILFATVLFLLQGPLRRWIGKSETGAGPGRGAIAGAILFQFSVGVYGGYFGAGIGIIMLAALGFLGLTDLHRMNALKNFFAICINGIAAVYFIVSGAVIWIDVLLMIAASIAGGYFGASLAYKLGRRFVRYAVIIIGLTMAVSLFLLRK